MKNVERLQIKKELIEGLKRNINFSVKARLKDWDSLSVFERMILENDIKEEYQRVMNAKKKYYGR